MLLRIAIQSLLNRRWTVLLTLFSLTISILLVLGMNHIRMQAKESFRNTLSGTDLIVGARGGAINLLLYSVFHLGSPTHNIRWETYEELAKHSQVRWLIPLALGDSHKGHRVVATTPDFFTHYAYGNKQPLHIVKGERFAKPFEIVLGAGVARKLNYHLGDKIILAHGIAEVSLAKHEDAPFVVTGILAPTGTPVDKSLYISLSGLEAIHRDWKSGVHIPQQNHSPGQTIDSGANPETVSAILVGLKTRSAMFTVQRQINQYTAEPLQAVVPGLALAELWQLVGSAETAFAIIAWLVVIASLLGMMTAMLTALNERQREFAILRSLGAGPEYLFMLIISEVFLICATATASAILMLMTALELLQPWLINSWGLHISPNVMSTNQLFYLTAMFTLAVALSVLPASVAYRRSLHNGLCVRL